MSKQKVFRVRKRIGLDKADALAFAKKTEWWHEGLLFYTNSSSKWFVWKEPTR